MKTTLRKTILLPAMFLMLVVCNAQTGSLYGIRTSQSNYSSQLVKINPSTGTQTVISPSSFGYGMLFGVSTLDPNGKFFYFITPGDTLFQINLNSGMIANKVKLSSAGTYSAPILEFNSFDNKLYGVAQKLSDNKNYFCTINPSTGSVTVLSTSSFSSMTTSTGASLTTTYLMNSTLDPINNLFYLTSEYYMDTLYGFNLITGNIDVRKRLSSNFTFSAPAYYQPQLEYSCSDATLYAMVKYNQNSCMYLSKANPATGSVTIISANPISNNFLNGVSTLDPVSKNFFHTMIPDSLYSTNLTTGTLTAKSSMMNSGYWMSALEYEQFCSQTGIHTINGDISAIQLYPNPCNGTLNVRIESDRTQLNVLNALGQEVFTQSLNEGTNQLNLQHLPPGLYFCTLMQNNRVIANSRLLIE